MEDFLDHSNRVDKHSFWGCLESGKPEIALLRDENSGYRFGVKATPTFFIDGERIVGMGREEELLRLLDEHERRSNGQVGGPGLRE